MKKGELPFCCMALLFFRDRRLRLFPIARNPFTEINLAARIIICSTHFYRVLRFWEDSCPGSRCTARTVLELAVCNKKSLCKFVIEWLPVEKHGSKFHRNNVLYKRAHLLLGFPIGTLVKTYVYRQTFQCVHLCRCVGKFFFR